MVLLNAAKAARHSASLITRTNICGGPKKAGIVPKVGFFMTSSAATRRAPQSLPKFCIPNRTIQTQNYGYRATHGGNMG